MAQDTQQYAEARKRLEEDLRSSRDDLRGIEEERLGLSQDDPLDQGTPTNHMADMGTEVYERERLASIEAELRARVQMIEDALGRIENGTYGTCQVCGGQIAPERLEVLPFATNCVECAERLERREGQQAGVKFDEPLTPDQGHAPGR